MTFNSLVGPVLPEIPILYQSTPKSKRFFSSGIAKKNCPQTEQALPYNPHLRHRTHAPTCGCSIWLTIFISQRGTLRPRKLFPERTSFAVQSTSHYVAGH
jgi:hypothetical protein